VGIVDYQGRSAAFTGGECFDWAGHIIGPGFACQGNILVGSSTVEAMARSFGSSQGRLADRLVAALAAGQTAGGDSRGQQSAALLVVRQHGGYGGFNDRYLDLRVDNHTEPIVELRRLLDLFTLYFERTPDEDLLPLDAGLTRALQEMLAAKGHHSGEHHGVFDAATQDALTNWAGMENLEERLASGAQLDPVLLDYLRRSCAEAPE
jgi:uncharacterized Ntn-hydrolase superfamily protein